MTGGRCPAGKKRPKGTSDSEVCVNNPKSKAKKNTWAHDGYKKSEAAGRPTRCGAGFRKSKKNPDVCIRRSVSNRNKLGQFVATKFDTSASVSSVRFKNKPGHQKSTHTKFT
jgi:hypothetical protein